jgi:hypothetical protein
MAFSSDAVPPQSFSPGRRTIGKAEPALVLILREFRPIQLTGVCDSITLQPYEPRRPRSIAYRLQKSYR